jgi:DNA-directed RNA polymerase specialized sigma24 family protein
MQQKSLNYFYSQYSKGKLERSKLEGLIYIHLIENQGRTRLYMWNRVEYEDFISWFFPRMQKSIDTYCKTASAFESFIYTILHVSAREFRVRSVTNSVTEYSAWSARIPDYYAHEDLPAYLTEKVQSSLSFENCKRKNVKQLTVLILKCYYYVSEDFLDRLLPETGIDRKKIMEMIEKIRILRAKHDDAIYHFKERIHCQYYRCIVYEKRLSYLSENMSAYAKLKIKLEKARERLDKMRKRIASIRTSATNKQIAEVIGISKGAVDSHLFTLKNKWENKNRQITADKNYSQTSCQNSNAKTAFSK